MCDSKKAGFEGTDHYGQNTETRPNWCDWQLSCYQPYCRQACVGCGHQEERVTATRVSPILTRVALAGLLAGLFALPASFLQAASAQTAVICPAVSPSGQVVPAPQDGVDWSGCDLSGAKMARAPLANANLSNANLTGANL